MKRAALACGLAVSGFAQNPAGVGEKVFAANCSVPYCHGANGTQGRAPRLAGHSFNARQLTNTVSNGIANTGMPPFKTQLSSDEINAVVAYLMTLRESSPSGVRGETRVRRVAEPPGKALFFDAVRMGGCGRCHELEKRGSAVAANITNIPADLHSIGASHVVTASPKGEPPFPGIVGDESGKRIRIYDLSSPLPVLRSFSRSDVEIAAGGQWTHRDALAGYSDAELKEIASYLRSVIGN